MLAGDHPVGKGMVTFLGMASLEPFTVAPQGSPQLFQTGESYKRIPIVNHQHQHDLLTFAAASASADSSSRRRVSRRRAGRKPPEHRAPAPRFDGVVTSRPLAITVAWGGNREFNGFNGNNDGYLAEGRVRITSTSTSYGRVEGADKELFGLGAHPKGLSHRHAYSRIYAFTAGYIRDLPVLKSSRLGIGADITTYWMAEDLRVFYDGSRSYHVFIRWRPVVAAPHAHF
jgi:hypothetical protein